MTEVEKLIHIITAGKYTHVIFDLDETLTRLDLPWDRWIHMIESRLSPPAAASFAQSIRKPSAAWGKLLNEHTERYEEFLPVLLEQSERFESAYFGHTPYHELIQAVHILAGEGRVLYAWSANMRSTIERAMVELGIRQYFTKIVAREDVRFTKPHPEGWQLLADATPRERFLFVGDSSNDELAAKALGITYYAIQFFK
ncbi:MAG: HAD family hydrolase [Candidatus Saccharimonadales bacterium]